MKRDEVLDTVKNIICKERNNQHGEPENTFPIIAENWTGYLRNVGLLSADQELKAYQVAEMMANFKECRHSVNPDHTDNRIDQIGYLALSIELRELEASKQVATGKRVFTSENSQHSKLRDYIVDKTKKAVRFYSNGFSVSAPCIFIDDLEDFTAVESFGYVFFEKRNYLFHNRKFIAK